MMPFTLWNLLSAICLICSPSVALSIAIHRSSNPVACVLVAITSLLLGAIWTAAMRLVGAWIARRLERASAESQTIYNVLVLGVSVGVIVLSMRASERVTTFLLSSLAHHGV